MYVSRRYDGNLQWNRSRNDVDNESLQKHGLPPGYRLPADLPSFQEIERLLALYVATGEGKGAYIAAKVAEEQSLDYKDRYQSRFSARPRPPRPSRYSHSHSDNDSGDDDDDDHGPRPPIRPSGGRPPGGRPPGGPIYAEAAVPPRPPRPVHIYNNTVHAEADFIIPPPPLAGPPPRPNIVHAEPHEPYQAEESDGLGEEPEYAALPSEEDDVLTSNRRDTTRMSSRRRASESRRFRRSQRMDSTRTRRQTRGDEPVIIDPERAPRTARPYTEEQRRRRERLELRVPPMDRPSVRYRGGGPADKIAPTKTSGVGAGVLPQGVYGTEPKSIFLYFFYISKGKIFTSRRVERYTTFQELSRNQDRMVDSRQREDRWFTNKLREHYFLINQRHQGIVHQILQLRTIGFATFLRFERTVAPVEDASGFAVTAKVPAIYAEGEAVSQFRYLLEYPLESAKMMLYNLDRLAASTERIRDRHSFYVVEIKETYHTGKIYFALGLLIVISTGGGTAYAVVCSDPSTGLSIATYVLTCLSLILALVAAGQWVGLSKPDAFSFAYSVERNQIIGATNVEKILDEGQLNTIFDR